MNTHDLPAIPNAGGIQPAVVPDGPVEGALVPLMSTGGKLFVMPNILHFYNPVVSSQPTDPKPVEVPVFERTQPSSESAHAANGRLAGNDEENYSSVPAGNGRQTGEFTREEWQ